MKQLDGRSKKACALKAEGLRCIAEQQAALNKLDAIVSAPAPEGGVGLRGQYVPIDFGTQAADRQVGGDHYKNLGIEPWDAMECWLTAEEFRGFLKGNAIKYLSRSNVKGGPTDVAKAQHYLQKLLELVGE